MHHSSSTQQNKMRSGKISNITIVLDIMMISLHNKPCMPPPTTYLKQKGKIIILRKKIHTPKQRSFSFLNIKRNKLRAHSSMSKILVVQRKR